MKAKSAAKIVIIILIICMTILLFSIFLLINKNISKNDSTTMNDNEQNMIVKNEITIGNEESNDVNDITEDSEEIGFDYNPDEPEVNLTEEDMSMLKREGILVPADEISEDGEIYYTEDEINNFDFGIIGLSDEILEYIKDVNNLKFQIKKYIYSNPQFANVTEATVYDYRFQNQNSTLTIYFNLNDDLRMLVTSIDLQSNTVEIEETFRDD